MLRDRSRILFVAPQFPPCNLTAGHRTRLFVRHLREFGLEAAVLTVREDCYETHFDGELLKLVDPDVKVWRTSALGTRPIRLVGDLGIRSFLQHFDHIRRLCKTWKPDLIYIPIPPNYSSLLGPLCRRMFGIPYAIDYIDPWVYPPTVNERGSWKAMASHRLARLLEPIVLRHVSGISSVSESYYADVLLRHPRLKNIPQAGIPYGGEPLDHDYVSANSLRSTILERADLAGFKVLTYAGAVLPTAHETLRTLLTAFRKWTESGESSAQNVRLLFVGTGASPSDPRSGIVMPIARECGCENAVIEIAERQPYVEILRLLGQSHTVLILGSSEAFYTASKTFQALHSQRPVLAMLHQDSSAAKILAESIGTYLVLFNRERQPRDCVNSTIDCLKAVSASGSGQPIARSLESLQPYSAREMTRRLACFFNEILQRNSTVST